VDLDVRRGEVHALLGENGAGKSTLMNVVYGLHQPDEGRVVLRGEPVHIGSPREAIGLRIGMVHQHFMLIPVMSVAENVVLASEPRRGALLDVAAAERRVRELSERFGLAVDPRARVEDIGVGQQQRVEILRVLHRGADILILDEPTAVLTAQESADLFKVLRSLTAQGVSVIFISHKLREVLEIADRVTVLRRGKKVGTVETKGATEASLAKLMVGRDVLFRLEKGDGERPAAPQPLLVIDGLEVEDERGLPAVNGLSLEVRAGEVVGLAGVDGNGQSELVEAIAGLRQPKAGSISVAGRDITRAGVRGAIAAGVGHIAEDRHRRGLVLDFSLAENLAMRDYRREARFGLLSPRRMVERSRRLLEEYDVRGGRPDAPASSLSGGNQQKVVIAREIAEEPQVLVAAQPTRGLDVGAIEFVHRRLLEQRAAGRGVLLVSLELEEIRALADRVLVIYEGRIVAELPPDASDEELGIAMTGGGRTAVAGG
jgi:simple sugar transport system ATP-binding protein